LVDLICNKPVKAFSMWKSTWKQSGMDVEKVEKLAKIYLNISIAGGLLSNSVTDTAESRIIS
jgi:3-keto-L-gulonate-6-phosphate decarboxylase